MKSEVNAVPKQRGGASDTKNPNTYYWHPNEHKVYRVSMYPCINRNARPNNNQLITYYLRVCYLLRIQKYPVNTTYNKDFMKIILFTFESKQKIAIAFDSVRFLLYSGDQNSELVQYSNGPKLFVH